MMTEEKSRISETSGEDPRNNVDLHYSFEWEDSGSAHIGTLQCKCGHWVVEFEDEVGIESHGCGDRSREIVECDGCGRVYEAEWVGMKLTEADQ